MTVDSVVEYELKDTNQNLDMKTEFIIQWQPEKFFWKMGLKYDSLLET